MSDQGHQTEGVGLGVLAWIGVSIVSFAVFLAIFSPWIIHYDPSQTSAAPVLHPQLSAKRERATLIEVVFLKRQVGWTRVGTVGLALA